MKIHASLATLAFASLSLAVGAPSSGHAQQNGQLRAPIAAKRTHTTRIHGRTLTDDYFWLRQKGDSSVVHYLEAENAHTAAVMKPTEPLQQTLYDEMLKRIKQTDLSVPYREGRYLYYSKTEEGKQSCGPRTTRRCS